MNSVPQSSTFAEVVYLAFSLIALYAAWRLFVAARERRGWREITARVLHLSAIGILLYTVGVELSQGQAVPSTARSPRDYMEFVAIGLLLIGQIIYGLKPRPPKQG